VAGRLVAGNLFAVRTSVTRLTMKVPSTRSLRAGSATISMMPQL